MPTLPEPCRMALGGEGTATYRTVSDKQNSLITPLFHVGEPSKCSTPRLCYLQPRSYFIVYGGHRLHTIAEWPCKGRGPVSAAFLPGSFLFLLAFTATNTCTFFSTSGFQESLTDIKQDDFSPHKTTTKKTVIGCYPTSPSTT